MYVLLQRQLKGWLINMHGQHPKPAIGPRICFTNVVGLLLGNHARAGATTSEWPTETALVVAVGHCNGVAQALTLEQIHRWKDLCADGV